MSAKCQWRTSAGHYSMTSSARSSISANRRCSRSALFNEFFSLREYRLRNFKSERPRGLPIEDEFKLGGSHYRQRGRCLTLEDTTGIDADLAVSFRGARSVTHQAADLDALTEGVNRRQPL